MRIRTEQNRTERNGTEQNGVEWNVWTDEPCFTEVSQTVKPRTFAIMFAARANNSMKRKEAWDGCDEFRTRV